MTVRPLSARDASTIVDVINAAAGAYQGVIPDDCFHQPYMAMAELRREIKRMTFWGWEEGRRITGVMGAEPVKDVTLVRHAYVLPESQGKGIGSNLLDHVRQATKTKLLLVGTWADAAWAVRFYEKHGFKLMPDKDELLKKYWDVPPRQIETSVVLGIEL